MRPALQAVTDKLRADGEWPSPLEYGAMLIKAGASTEEMISMTRVYKEALFHGWSRAGPVPYAEDELMASLRSFGSW